MLRSAVSVLELLIGPEFSLEVFLKTHTVFAVVDIMRDVKFIIISLRDRVDDAESSERWISSSKVHLSGPDAIRKAELWCPFCDACFIGHRALIRCSFDCNLWAFNSVEDEIGLAVEKRQDFVLQFATDQCQSWFSREPTNDACLITSATFWFDDQSELRNNILVTLEAENIFEDVIANLSRQIE